MLYQRVFFFSLSNFLSPLPQYAFFIVMLYYNSGENKTFDVIKMKISPT